MRASESRPETESPKLTVGQSAHVCLVHDDEVNGLTAARMTVVVEVGKTAHLDTAEGKSLEFKCQAGAQAMSIEVLNRAAQLAPPRIR